VAFICLLAFFAFVIFNDLTKLNLSLTLAQPGTNPAGESHAGFHVARKSDAPATIPLRDLANDLFLMRVLHFLILQRRTLARFWAESPSLLQEIYPRRSLSSLLLPSSASSRSYLHPRSSPDWELPPPHMGHF
jgi:hypothetical protein